MKIIAFIILIVFTILGSNCFGDELTNECQNDKILTLILQSYFGDYSDYSKSGDYAVIDPKTCTYIFNEMKLEYTERAKKALRNYMSAKGFELGLIENLYDKNKKQVFLSVKSDPKNGYVINYNDSLKPYKGEDPVGFEKWRKENPKIRGFFRMSLPVWDRECRIFLVYLEKKYWGMVLFLKKESGKLEVIGGVDLWKS